MTFLDRNFPAWVPTSFPDMLVCSLWQHKTVSKSWMAQVCSFLQLRCNHRPHQEAQLEVQWASENTRSHNTAIEGVISIMATGFICGTTMEKASACSICWQSTVRKSAHSLQTLNIKRKSVTRVEWCLDKQGLSIGVAAPLLVLQVLGCIAWVEAGNCKVRL